MVRVRMGAEIPSGGVMNIWRRFMDWLDERRSLRICGCACFCPACSSVLNVRGIVFERAADEPWVSYLCRCGKVSTWDYDSAPVPLMVRV